jgi:hypothetical protein
VNNLKLVSNSLAVVTEMPHKPIMNQFKKITEELLLAHFSGVVLFDLAISKGLEERFVQVIFDGAKINRNSFVQVNNSKVPPNVLKTQNTFFSNNSTLLKSSMLTSSEIEQLS